MPGPPLIQPIAPPLPPGRPIPGATPRIAPLPSDGPVLLSDPELATALQALRPQPSAAPAILAAYRAFGDKYRFEPRLIDALTAIPLEIDDRLQIHIARLSAETFVLDIQVGGDKVDMIGFVQRLDDSSASGDGAAFLQYVARRLLDLSSAEMDDDFRRVQMNKALAFFELAQAELDRMFSTIPLSSTVLAEDRLLMFEIVQKHYQLLLDGLFMSARGTAYKRAITTLTDHFTATKALDKEFKDPKPTVPAFLIVGGNTFRDMFNRDRTSDFRFKFFSKSAPPLTGGGPTTTFREVLRKRFQQIARFTDIQPGPHAPGGASFPDPPKLHDDVSWQAWVRKMWDSGLLDKPTVDALAALCKVLSGYFNAFTVHEPFDLDEGARTESYLTRTIPRAINGGLVHDCLVYATRWLFMLGLLFKAKTMPQDLSEPKIALIEMPVHVGVLIRVRVTPDAALAIAINNQDYDITEAGIDDDLDTLSSKVVAGMYAGLKTPILIHPLTAEPSDAAALWRFIARLADTQTVLPYVDSTEPQVLYLTFNAEKAKIQKALNEALNTSYVTVRALGPKQDRKKLRDALARYKQDADRAFQTAAKDFTNTVKPIADAINADIDAKEQDKKLPKDAVIKVGGALQNWQVERDLYLKQVDVAAETGDLSTIDPDTAYPGDGFPTDVQ